MIITCTQCEEHNLIRHLPEPTSPLKCARCGLQLPIDECLYKTSIPSTIQDEPFLIELYQLGFVDGYLLLGRGSIADCNSTFSPREFNVYRLGYARGEQSAGRKFPFHENWRDNTLPETETLDEIISRIEGNPAFGIWDRDSSGNSDWRSIGNLVLPNPRLHRVCLWLTSLSDQNHELELNL